MVYTEAASRQPRSFTHPRITAINDHCLVFDCNHLPIPALIVVHLVNSVESKLDSINVDASIVLVVNPLRIVGLILRVTVRLNEHGHVVVVAAIYATAPAALTR